MECSICGISGEKRRVFHAVSPTGIILVCESCASEAGFPMVKKPEINPDKENKIDSVYDTMVRLSGVQPKEKKSERIKAYEIRQKETFSLNPRPDLVDKFHWIIMRVRRVKGLTQKQLAERIGESEKSIKMAEQGIVPTGYAFLEKLERFLRVKLIKDRNPAPTINTDSNFKGSNPFLRDEINKIPAKPQPARSLSFNKKALDSLTIADLKKMKEEKENVGKGQK